MRGIIEGYAAITLGKGYEMAAKAIWTVIPRESINLDEMVELPFGRFNEALPFVQAWIDSGEFESDFVNLDMSARGKLQRAIVKLSKVQLSLRTEKKDGTKLDKPVAVIDADSIARACAKLQIELVKHASKAGDIEVMSLRKTA